VSGANLHFPVNEPAGRKIIRADRALRRLTLIGVVVLLLAGVIAIVYTESFLHDMKALARESASLAAARVGLVLKLIAIGAAVIPIAVGTYLTRIAVLTWRSSEFPPPGTRVLRDTTVTTGPRSRRWAIFAFAVAAILLLGGILVPLVTWNLVEGLLRSSAGRGGV
jgi:hypothetical protein